MKIGLIGNMNNNNFALMRYFRDLGADAHLLLYSNDGQGSLSHFKPEADTWEIEKWRPYIHQTSIPNAPIAALQPPLSWLSSLYSMTRWVLQQRNPWLRPISKNNIEKTFSDYDVLIGSGIAPSLLEKIGRRLDIFYPYSIGIEFYNNAAFKPTSPLHRLAYSYIRKLQAHGIHNARHCLNSEMSTTKNSFDEIGCPFKTLAIPMVYNRENLKKSDTLQRFHKVTHQLASSDLSLFCCSRMLFKKSKYYSDQEWSSVTKNSDWLFYGLSQFIHDHPEAKPLLVVIEYGPDVEYAKQLVKSLGINQYVVWLPKMLRKEIMFLLDLCDIGVGEFYTDYGVLWGGTGWEILARGKPLLQSFNYTDVDFTKKFGYSAPPILDVKSPEDIAIHLSNIYKNEHQLANIGEASARWFDSHNGINLAKKWLELIT